MDRTDGLISKLITSLQTYLGLQKEYAMLELTEKLSRLLTALILGAILFILGIFVVVFAGFTLACLLKDLLESATLAYAIVTAIFISVCILFYKMRHQWLATPLTNFFTNLLLNDHEKGQHPF